MINGFVKVKCVSPEIKLGAPGYNADLIINEINKAQSEGVALLAFPELVLCGYTLRDMVGTPAIVSGSKNALERILEKTENTSVIAFIGLPICANGKLYNAVAIIQGGVVIGIVPKTKFPKGSAFGEDRVFSVPSGIADCYLGERAPIICADIILKIDEDDTMAVGCVVGDNPEAVAKLSKMGATIIVNPASSPLLVSSIKNDLLLSLARSKDSICGYIRCNGSENESTTDALIAPHNMICENGDLLARALPFESKTGECVSEIDTHYLAFKRFKSGFYDGFDDERAGARTLLAYSLDEVTSLTRKISAHPFILDDKDEMAQRCESILSIQAHALARRLKATGSKSAVIGISGGLDSTLALIAMARAFDCLNMDRKNIIAVTMPCFGTTERTKSNAIDLCNAFGVTLREINIFDATRIHLRDIAHDESVKNAAYENAQARERTQILMDIANDCGGIVVGTGDLSEVALGWATYNGDHMSMYNVNGDIPKTLVRYIVSYFASVSEDKIKAVLNDIVNTPVSPELLPANDKGEIQQKTEDLIGPYELHDFFLYNFISKGYSPSKLYRVANYVFEGVYDKDTVYKWLCNFIKRFVAQQFKRSCSPDGIKVGTVSLSPRGDLSMPSDMSYDALIEELNAHI